MNTKTILIIDDDTKNIEVLVSGLVNNQFQVVTTNSGYNGLIKARQLNPDLILMDTEIGDLGGIEFVRKLREDAQIAEIPVILLSTRDGLQDRIKAYEVGIKDYIVKPMHVSEIVARIKMILFRVEQRQSEQDAKMGRISGNLEEKSLAEIIKDFAMNHVTGILTVTSGFGKSGQVFFRNGQVINAIVGNFRGERAVYLMIPWSRGKYTMVFQEIDIKDEVGISNLGLLLQARKRLEQRAQLLQQLPGLHSILTISSTFLHIIENRKMSADVMRFIQLFNGERTVQRVLEDSFQDDLVTLERIVKMYQQEFLTELPQKITVKSEEGRVPQKIEPIFTEEEYQTFQRRVLRPDEQQRRALFLLGTSGSGKNEVVQLLAGPSYRTKTMKSLFPFPVDLGKVAIAAEQEISLLGIPVEKNLREFVDSLEDHMLGYIILVSAIEPDTFSYLGYLIKTFRNRYQLPYAIAVSNLRHAQAIGIESLTPQLGLESYEELMPCNPRDLDNVKMLMLNLHSPYTSREYLQIPVNIGH